MLIVSIINILDGYRDPRTRRMFHSKPIIGKFAQSERGASAIEFALILPILLSVLFAMVELSQLIYNWRKISLTARTISDLTAQGDTQSPMRSNLMNDIFAAANLTLRPFNGQAAKIVVSVMGVDQNIVTLPPRVCSSIATTNASPRASGVIALGHTVPTGMGLQGMRYIFVEIEMSYTPMLGSAIIDLFGNRGGQIMLRTSMPWPVRKGETFPPSKYPEIILPNGVRC